MKLLVGALLAIGLFTIAGPAEAVDCTPGTVESLSVACQGTAYQAQTQGVTVTTNDRAPGIAIAPAVFAPGLTAGGIVCLGSKSGGVSVGVIGVGAGLSLGSTVEDEKCNSRADAAALASLGDVDAAKARLCQRAEIATAYATAGRPCAVPVRPVELPGPQNQSGEVLRRVQSN